MMMNFKKTTLAVLAGTILSGGVWAVDPPKEGSTEISLTVANGSNGGGGNGLLMLKHLSSTIDLETFSNTNFNPSAGSDFCIYASGVSSAFSVELTTAGSAKDENNADVSGFALTSGANSVPYTVDVYSRNSATGTPVNYSAEGTQILSGLAKTALDASLDCVANVDAGAVARNAYVKVSVAPEAASTAPAGSYTGTLTLTVAAN